MCLLDDGEVGGEVHIVHTVKAETADSGDHLALNVSAGLVAEALADSSADGGSRADHDMLVRVCKSLKHARGVVLLIERADRARNDALTAGDAGGLCESLIERRCYKRIKAAVDCGNRADTLIVARADAAAAEDTLIIIADEEGWCAC